MKKIIFKSVTFQNFFSFGNIPITFDLTNGLNLLCGENGSGKTTVFNAIRYALFNSVDRDIKMVQFINNVNQKKMHVKLIFEINGIEYIIERGLKPSVFKVFIDGIEEDIDSKKTIFQKNFEADVLGFNDDLFMKFISIDSDYPSFFTLKKSDREGFINNFVDFEKIDDFKSLNSEYTHTIKEERSSNEGELNGIKYSIQGLLFDAKRIKEKDSSQAIIKKKEDEIKTKKDTIKGIKKSLASSRKELKSLPKVTSGNIDEALYWIQKEQESFDFIKSDLVSKKSEYRSIKKYIKELEDFNFDTKSCLEELKGRIKSDAKKLSIIDSDIKLLEDDITHRKSKWSVQNNLSDYVKLCMELEKKRDSLDYLIETGVSDIEKLNDSINKIEDDINEIKLSDEADKKIELEEIEKKVKAHVDRKQTLDDSISYIDTNLEYSKSLSNILNKKTKLYFISKIRPFINTKLNKYLGELKSTFIVKFTDNNLTEVEFRSVAQRGFTYGNLSKGQKKILDLALMLSFRDLFEVTRGISINLFIFDEYFANVSEISFLDIIFNLKNTLRGHSINITLHNKSALDQLKCDRYLEFEYDGTFSKMVEN